jgi:uncharacterized protein YbjT (DUF2867 family)
MEPDVRKSRALIIGATGRVGAATLAALDSLPDDTRPQVAVYVRRPEAVPATRHPLTVIKGDISDQTTLISALTGIDAALVITGDTRDQATLERTVIAAACAAGRPRIVKLSAITAGLVPRVSFGRVHGIVEDEIRASGLPFTILRPTMFFQSLELFAGPVKKMGQLIAPSQQGAVSFVDVRDVGAVAAHMLSSDGHEGRTYTLTGGAALTMGAVADALSRCIERPVRHMSPPPPLARLMMQLSGDMDWWLSGMVAELFAAIRNGRESIVTSDLARILGRPPTTLEDYLAHSEAFWSAAS